MSLALNKPKLDNLANEIWKSAERLRGKFKAYEYQGVILPIIVIRRLECVLLAWREAKSAEVLEKRPGLKDKPKELAKLVKELELNPKQSPFSNATDWTLASVYAEDHALLEKNFRAYINGFSKNVEDIIEHFNYRATIGTMVKNNRLAPILNQYQSLALGPDQLSALEMGYVYEELLRRFSEQSGEEAGDHFTPREVIRLMVELLEIPIPEKHFSIYDPAGGTGGMLSVSKEHLLDRAKNPAERERVEKFLTVHGQEISPTNYAVCQADLLIKNDKQAKVTLGNSLIPHDPQSKDPGDQWPESKWRFNRMLSNPPFGVTWGGKDGYETEARKLETTRYQAGMPRVNDGALLFLETMLAKMISPDDGGSRIAIVFNGSPLSNGDCGSGESEIRRWILENDWLDAIVMLPDQLFYNTGIFTYIWLLRNEKPAGHRGRVMLIDARQQFEKEPKAFANKRNRITDAHHAWIEERYFSGWGKNYSDEQVKIFRREDFAYHKVAVVFWQADESDQPAIITEPYEKSLTAATVAKELQFYESELIFRVRVKTTDGEKIITLTLAAKDNAAKKFKATFDDRPEILSVEWTHRHYVEDYEYIPYGEDIAAFLKREIAKPIIRWEDSPQLGYEILPNKYFYRYQPPTPAKDLLKEFWKLEKDAEQMLEGIGEMSVVESNDIWLDVMPSDWRRSRIRNVAQMSPGYSASQPVPEEPCTVVPMELLSEDGKIDVTNQQSFADVTSGLTFFEAGDVLFAKITPCMENGKGAFVRVLPTRYAFGSTEFHVLRPGKKIDAAFLYYATFNPIYRAYAAENMVGGSGPKTCFNSICKRHSPVPPAATGAEAHRDLSGCQLRGPRRRRRRQALPT